VGLLSYVDP